MDKYKNLKVWVEAYNLSLLIYKTTQHFPKEEMFGVVSQLRRSIISVAANIAEGKGRFSQKELVRYLFIARGSLFETEYYIRISKDLGYLEEKDFREIQEKVNLVGKLINGLIRSIKEPASRKEKAYN